MARSISLLLTATFALLLIMAIALGVGAVNVPVLDVLGVVVGRLGLGGGKVELIDDQIIWQMRMPRVLGAAAVGAGLAVSGAVLQSLTRNDLADPYLLGISGGASVGAVSVLVLGVAVAGIGGAAALTGAAFLGALGASAVVLVLATGRSGELPPARTVLAGVAVGQACAAGTSFIVMVLGDNQAARRALEWTLGSVAGLRWPSALFLVSAAVVITFALLTRASTLDAFAFGETSARALGVNVERTRWALLGGTALLTACLVGFVGAIGFVGLVVPHMVRIVSGPGHRLLLPLSALVGAVVLVAADLAARSVVDGQEIPIGVITGVVGAPFFAWLLRRHRETA